MAMQNSAAAPLSVAVIGHTNVGKTSLMRTLLRNSRFGEVSDHPGTTRHVEAAVIHSDERSLIELHDTPGLEDSIGLRAALETLSGEAAKNGRARLRAFVADGDQYPDLDQELKVVRQLLSSDLLFYVIDVREPLVGKYRDELYILSMAGKAVIPVLNFIHATSTHRTAWRDYLAELHFHAQVEFDTVVFRLEDEKRLFQKIQSLLGDYYEPLQQLIDERQSEAMRIRRASAAAIAGLVIDVGTYRRVLTGAAAEPTDQQKREIAELQDSTRLAERACIRQVITLHGFTVDDVRETFLPVEDGSWTLDLFDADTLRTFGLKASSGAAQGAAVGAVFDGLTGFISLGAAAATGALAGALFSTGSRFGKDIQAAVTGRRILCVEDQTIRLLWLRQLQLLVDLGSRGHAAQGQLQVRSVDKDDLPQEWKAWLRRMRNNPQWSGLGGAAVDESDARQELLDAMTGQLLSAVDFLAAPPRDQ